jgi:hypothetical protein
MNQIKIALAYFVLTAILVGLIFQAQVLAALAVTIFEILRQHFLAVVVAVTVLVAIKTVSAGPRLGSR